MAPVDMSGVDSKKGGAGGLLPPGTYEARITDAYEVHADSGTDGIGVDFEVILGEETGQRISDTLWLTPKSMPYSKFKVEVVGGAIPAGVFEVAKSDPDFARLCASMIGKRAKIVVGMEPDRKDPSKSWPRVKGWDASSGAAAGAGAPTTGASTRNDDIPF